jgi:hypothetical protein
MKESLKQQIPHKILNVTYTQTVFTESRIILLTKFTSITSQSLFLSFVIIVNKKIEIFVSNSPGASTIFVVVA